MLGFMNYDVDKAGIENRCMDINYLIIHYMET